MNFDLNISKVTVELNIPYHASYCDKTKDCAPGCNLGTGRFTVDLRTGQCHGEMINAIVISDKDLWKKICDYVSKEVRSRFSNDTAIVPSKPIVEKLRPGFGEWSD